MATFYLKYRPQTIDDLDLTSVRNQLNKVLASKSIPHAFLFSGPRGLGKTSSARIIAKAVNCLDKKKNSIEPCNECEVCSSITKGSSIDVIEIDGASNRGIDDVRALREAVISVPLNLTKKVIVIDEVHMLTKEAFNALLKMLEEPPEHVLFILATTEPQKLPDTVVSRAFHIRFERASDGELRRSLKRVIDGEKLKVSDTVLAEVISRSEGGFRDATKMLEQLSFSSKEITDDVFIEVFPQTDIGIFLEELSLKNTIACFNWIEKTNDIGIAWEEVVRQILEKLRSYLLANFGIGTVRKKLFDNQELEKLIDLSLKTFSRIKYSPLPTLAMEMLVLEWCGSRESGVGKQESGVEKQESRVRSHESGIRNQKLEKKEDKKKNSGDENKAEEKLDAEDIELGDKSLSLEDGDKISVDKLIKEDKVVEKSKMILREEMNESVVRANSKIKFEDVNNNWKKILEYIRPNNFSLEALLKSSEPVDLKDGVLVIKVFYEFHKGRLETDKCLGTLEEAFVRILGEKPRIKYVLGERQEREEKIKKDDKKLAETVEEVFG